MEQATNLFTKGLQMDTHPMVQGNDTLTDCLNGTLITMNGDEVILQNDMGNRRVDLAFLPAGYEPVGMKEYGGIIYIVAYNPITNKSQIGSFPSPLRKYINNTPLTSPNISLVLCNGEWLNTSPTLSKITNDPIHVGDKFAFCFTSGENTNNLSNCNNTIDGKIITPKNKQYTLSIGVLDESGKFYDITSRLCRWKSGNIVSYNNNESDLYKFNDGYFISSVDVGNNNDDTKFPTIADLDLAEARFMKIYGNTYSEKFIGPLYLKIQQNYMQTFTYDLQAYKTEDNNHNVKIKIKINGRLTYNCPDGCLTSNDNLSIGDDIYYKYWTLMTSDASTHLPNFLFFDFYKDDVIQSPNSATVNVSYDKITNLYTANVILNFEFNDSDTSFKYDIKVIANSLCGSYIKELSSLDNYFDSSLINSNILELTGWRFKNNVENKVTTIAYSLKAYPAKNVRFVNLIMIFEDVTDSSNKYIYRKASINNGINKVDINWDEPDLEGRYLLKRKLYKVTLKYNKINELTGELIPASNNHTVIEANPNNPNFYEDLFLYTEPIELVENPLNPEISENPSRSVGIVREILTEYYNEVTYPSLVDLPSGTNPPDYLKLWLLTTELLNDCYNTVFNFCEAGYDDDNAYLYNTEITNKLKIKHSIRFYDTNINYTQDLKEYIGKPFSLSANGTTKYYCKHTVTFTVTGKYEINYDEELYPDFVNVDISLGTLSIDTKQFGKSIIDLIKNGNNGIDVTEFLLSVYPNITLTRDTKTFATGDIIIYYYDLLNGTTDTLKTVRLNKAVIPFSLVIYDKLLPNSLHLDEEFVTPTIEDNSYTSQQYIQAHCPTLYTSSGMDKTPNSTTNGSHNDDFEIRQLGGINNLAYDGLGIINYFSYGSRKLKFNTRLFTYLSPKSGLRSPNSNNGNDYVINFKQPSTTISNLDIEIDNSHNNDVVRVFAKVKNSTNNYNWVLVKLDDEYFLYVNSDDIDNLTNILTKYTTVDNNVSTLNTVYVFTKIYDTEGKEGRNITIYYCSDLVRTGDYTLDISIVPNFLPNHNYMGINNRTANNTVVTNIFTGSLSLYGSLSDMSSEQTGVIKVADINTSDSDLNSILSSILSNNGHSNLGIIALKPSNEVVIINEDAQGYFNDDFYKFYYYSSNEERFVPLNSKISLNDSCLMIDSSDIESTVLNNVIYDEYTLDLPNSPYFNSRVFYEKYISLNEINIFSTQ